jgi:hypothetical protein
MTGKLPRKRNSGSAGMKTLMTIASITAVIGGWAGFTLKESASAKPEAPEDVNEDETNTANFVYELPPIPTLIPEPVRLTNRQLSAVLPNANIPAVNPVNGLPIVTPIPTSLPSVKKEVDKSAPSKSSDKSSSKGKEPTSRTKSS